MPTLERLKLVKAVGGGRNARHIGTCDLTRQIGSGSFRPYFRSPRVVSPSFIISALKNEI